jgi:hypothetical protein
MLTVILLAQQITGSGMSGHVFSQSTVRHLMTGTHTALDLVLVALGAIVVIATTIYTVWFLIRPGEAGDEHIKRRILADGREGFR